MIEPGDLVEVNRGSSARLYRTNEMWEDPKGIAAIVHTGEVGLVLGTVYKERSSDMHPVAVHLMLFGEKLGWRDSLPFRVIP